MYSLLKKWETFLRNSYGSMIESGKIDLESLISIIKQDASKLDALEIFDFFGALYNLAAQLEEEGQKAKLLNLYDEYRLHFRTWLDPEDLWVVVRGVRDGSFDSTVLLYTWGIELPSRTALRLLVNTLGGEKVSKIIIESCKRKEFTYQQALTIFISLLTIVLVKPERTTFSSLFVLLQYILPLVPDSEYPTKKWAEEECVILFRFALRRVGKAWQTAEMIRFIDNYQFSPIRQFRNFLSQKRSDEEMHDYLDKCINEISIEEVLDYLFHRKAQKIPDRREDTPFIYLAVQKNPDRFIKQLQSLYSAGILSRSDIESLTVQFAQAEAEYGLKISPTFRKKFTSLFL